MTSLDEDALTKRDFFPSPQNLDILNKYIEAVEKEVFGLRKALDALQQQHSARDNVLQKLRFATMSVRKLPPELLVEIFHWLSLLYHEDDPRSDQITLPWSNRRRPGRPWQFDLIHTCFTWRQAALNSPFLWTNFLIVTPGKGVEMWDQQSDSSDDSEEGLWRYRKEWVIRLGRALKLLSSSKSLIVGIDLDRSGLHFDTAWELAVKHLFDPLMETGKSTTIAVKGYYGQNDAIFAIPFKHPESLEHIIVRDMGSDNQVDEYIDFKPPIWGETVRNLRRAEFIAINKKSLLFKDSPPMYEGFPWEQLTHLVIRDPHGNADLDILDNVIRRCKNLTSLTITHRSLAAEDGEGNDAHLQLKPEIILPFLQELVTNFGSMRFFRVFKFPSLASLKIQTEQNYRVDELPNFIRRSGSSESMKSFRELPQALVQTSGTWTTTTIAFRSLAQSMPNLKIFETITILTKSDIADIARGELLPSAEVLQFYTRVSLEKVTQILRPRFLANSSQHRATNFSRLKEVFISTNSSYSKEQIGNPFYIDGTRIEVVRQRSQAARIQVRPVLVS